MRLCCSDLDVGLVLPELGGDDLGDVGGEGGAVDLGPGHLPEPRQVVPCSLSVTRHSDGQPLSHSDVNFRICQSIFICQA